MSKLTKFGFIDGWHPRGNRENVRQSNTFSVQSQASKKEAYPSGSKLRRWACSLLFLRGIWVWRGATHQSLSTNQVRTFPILLSTSANVQRNLLFQRRSLLRVRKNLNPKRCHAPKPLSKPGLSFSSTPNTLANVNKLGNLLWALPLAPTVTTTEVTPLVLLMEKEKATRNTNAPKPGSVSSLGESTSLKTVPLLSGTQRRHKVVCSRSVAGVWHFFSVHASTEGRKEETKGASSRGEEESMFGLTLSNFEGKRSSKEEDKATSKWWLETVCSRARLWRQVHCLATTLICLDLPILDRLTLSRKLTWCDHTSRQSKNRLLLLYVHRGVAIVEPLGLNLFALAAQTGENGLRLVTRLIILKEGATISVGYQVLLHPWEMPLRRRHNQSDANFWRPSK